MTTKKKAPAAPVPSPEDDLIGAARRRRAQLETKLILRPKEAEELGLITSIKTFERDRKAGVYDEAVVQLGANSIGLRRSVLDAKMAGQAA
ncbi:MAG TPA: hypothetical protein VGI95_17255 [Caulobacteraceae bacterium]|jgi:hypothetical protein